MTHDELLAKINKPQINTIVYEGLESYVEILALMASRNALRAVVKLHKQRGDLCKTCLHRYPCTTIKAIENELK